MIAYWTPKPYRTLYLAGTPSITWPLPEQKATVDPDDMRLLIGDAHVKVLSVA